MAESQVEQTVVAPEMQTIPAGDFLMGSTAEAALDNEKPAHRVWCDAFLLARYPVSNREYRRFVEATGCIEPPAWREERFSHPDMPVVTISWHDALAYCEWLGKETGRRYRLPTEAEREKAMRSGVDGEEYSWGNEMPELTGDYAMGKTTVDRPMIIGSTPPNRYGLYHISDNVHEWCSDWYSPTYYAESPERNPTGPDNGTRRSSRGGAWRHHTKFSRNAARNSLDPTYRYDDYGFRVAADIEP